MFNQEFINLPANIFKIGCLTKNSSIYRQNCLEIGCLICTGAFGEWTVLFFILFLITSFNFKKNEVILLNKAEYDAVVRDVDARAINRLKAIGTCSVSLVSSHIQDGTRFMYRPSFQVYHFKIWIIQVEPKLISQTQETWYYSNAFLFPT